MGKVFESITDKQVGWIEAQKIFFVATAPLSQEGLINVSPKGLDTFRILDRNTVAYLDLAGSGIETISHIQQNSRITIMFTAFEGSPKSLRLYGKGEVIKFNSEKFEKYYSHFIPHVGIRSIIKVNLIRIQDSCGWSIPLYKYVGDRGVYDKYCDTKGREKLIQEIENGNSSSLDGLPGF